MDEVEKKSHQILLDAFATEASDIHFLPRKKDTLVELRIHNHLYELDLLPQRFAERIVSHFKFLSGMDIGERRRPQNGAMEVTLQSRYVHLRLSTLPTSYNESLVIRLLPQKLDLLVTDLSIFSEATTQLMSLLNYENGLILLSGPTGSGKTTTLYTLLQAAKRKFNARVITLEDPVEKKNDAFLQMEINEKANVGYSDGFKAILRHDPDIIMIGEIRDIGTAKIAVRAALTGHLVFSTVHAFDTTGTIQRMIELGIPRYDLKEMLVGVIAQRLVTITCPTCGPVCKPQCPNRHHSKRTGIFEVLAGMALHEQLIDSKRKHRAAYKTLDDYQRQGVSLGYIPKSSLVSPRDNQHVQT
ncbi:competence-related pilin export protein ComGA [Scopulibacillus darangshiensis]|uniref:Competence-related pilin export protein ComGA n=1 Tax=Scopulibacillus darangshiensis TaxID=442528 RepID=A0A4R2P848_9BACL|nr:competence type IV pilus ATPase ComGA [Scopulibacillus darangshiensis]TCP31150.1 competence-related pilin export protein ComGA [Scopulibacillus darangshiensis]